MHTYDSLNADCKNISHGNRRTLLMGAGIAGLNWLSPVSQVLSSQAQKIDLGRPAKSVILLWMQGAPSQLETFDPHPGTNIAAESKARKTSVKTIQVGAGLEQVADLMQDISLVRSVTSAEGDHERAVYNIKTGFRPDPTLLHPAIGSVICHQSKTADQGIVDIPRHVSIFSDKTAGRGGYLGNEYDAFKMQDPIKPLPDLQKRVAEGRFKRRMSTLDFLESNDPLRRHRSTTKTGRGPTMQAALRMMTSDQLKAFDISSVPTALQREFGDTPFGRGCLTALRLIEVGVRCVEVTLPGWDSHVNNHEIQAGQIDILDPAFAALIRNLKLRDRFDETVVVCGGEFGRTPKINGAGGRDHWPHGFSIAMAGGGIQGGQTVGATAPNPKLDPKNRQQDISEIKRVEDIHATILSALDIDFSQEIDTPVGRPMIISKGEVLTELLS